MSVLAQCPSVGASVLQSFLGFVTSLCPSVSISLSVSFCVG